MASTTFSAGTTITSVWLNDVNGVIWTLFGGATTATAGRTALGTGGLTTANTWSALNSFTLGLTVTGAAFTSRGITDNATTTALTLSGSEANSVTIANSATTPTISTTAGNLAITPAVNVTGNVGIGGAAASNCALDILSTQANGQIRARYDSSGLGLLIRQGSSGGAVTIANQANNDLVLNANNAEVVRLAASGNVTLGGGSATPALSVVPVASQNRYVTITGSNGGNPVIGTSGGNLVLQASTGTTRVSSTASATFAVSAAGASDTTAINLSNGTGALLSLSASGASVLVNAQQSGGGFTFYSNNGGATIFQLSAGAPTDPNYVSAISAASGANPRIYSSSNNLVIGGGAALATSATSGHMMIPSCAGAPTGAVTGAAAGQIPLVWDSTNNKLWTLSGGTWRGVVLT